MAEFGRSGILRGSNLSQKYTLIRKVWDPMKIELVPVWNDLFLAANCQRKTTMPYCVYSRYIALWNELFSIF